MERFLTLLAGIIYAFGTIGAQNNRTVYQRRQVNQYGTSSRQRSNIILNRQQNERHRTPAKNVAPKVVVSQEPLFLGDNYYHKRMVKVFSALKEHKLDKAADYWNDIKEKAAKDKNIDASRPIIEQLYPVWQLSECMMMSIKEGRGKSKDCLPYDSWRAYSTLQKILAKDLLVWDAKMFLLHKDIEMLVTDIKGDIEKNLLEETRAENTESSYDRLINTLFDYNDITSIEQEREQVAFTTISKLNQVEECQRFLDKYQKQNPAHLLYIEQHRDSLAFVQLDTTANACKSYLSSYPNSRFVSEVTSLLHLYAYNELKPTVEECKEYIRLYPSSKYVMNVKVKQEEYAFRDTKQNNSFSAYREFLSNYDKSEYAEEARNLMEIALKKRFFISSVSQNDLYRYFSTSNGAKGVDDSPLNILYTNLLFLPTSSISMECDGLIGEVIITTEANGNESEEVLDFNKQGLMIRHSHSRSGRNDKYQYDFDADNGFRMVSKTDNKNNTTTYTTRWNEKGEIIEIKGNDGSRIAYVDDSGCVKKVVYYKGKDVVKTDYYGYRFRLEKSERGGGITIRYEYNDEGDVKAMYKQRGSTVMETTTYEYEYTKGAGESRVWNTMRQYNNGNLSLTKHRRYVDMIDRVQSSMHRSYIVK